MYGKRRTMCLNVRKNCCLVNGWHVTTVAFTMDMLTTAKKFTISESLWSNPMTKHNPIKVRTLRALTVKFQELKSASDEGK
jgi:hypothetical protein